MQASMKTSQVVTYIFIPMLCALLISASVNLQLFQDGSSYLFEILESKTAIRHERLSALLFQAPIIATGRVLNRINANESSHLEVMRLIFSISYAIIPLLALTLSWLVVRRRNEHLFVWAALIILFINLVNFSWVSELLIALQFVCPLLLVSITSPHTRYSWALAILLSALAFFLHPLILPLFVALTIGGFYKAYRSGGLKTGALLMPLFFLAIAAGKGVASLFTLTPYESSFLGRNEMIEYLFETSLENIVFLIIALVIGLLCLRTAFSSTHEASRTLWSYRWAMILAVVGGVLLPLQYLWSDRGFPLKTGLALGASIGIIGMAFIDSSRAISSFEKAMRQKLVVLLATIFALVIVSKSAIWYSSVHTLEESLARAQTPCNEVVSAEFMWVKKSPYTIIDNWALPSLALVIQDSQPRKLLLEEQDCKQFYEMGMVQIDPWTNLPKELIVPALN